MQTLLLEYSANAKDRPNYPSLNGESQGRSIRDAALHTALKPHNVGSIVTAWLRASSRLAVVIVPALFIWSIVTAAVLQLLPANVGNNFMGVVLAAITGTLLMISTWTEIPVALQLIQSGWTGPAATLLVVLRPLSLPCVTLLGGLLGRFRSVVILTFTVSGVPPAI
jgi:uncharacterized membrane protein YraQ (UPF0718 family)